MISVEVLNFQSLEKVNLDIQGFTALVGRSNIGKSAIVRAIKSALTGATGTDFVRHGQTCERRLKGNKKCRCQASVRIKTSDVEFLWEKGDSVNRYTVWRDGVETVHDRVERGAPDFLGPAFSPVKVGDQHEVIQISDQFNPIFLLDKSGPTVADVLSDVAQLDEINVAMGLVNRDRKEATSTRKVREKDLADIRTSLKTYDGLDGAVARVRGVTAQHTLIGNAASSLKRLIRYVDQEAALGTEVIALEEATRPGTPDVESLSKKRQAATFLDRCVVSGMALSSQVKSLQGVASLEVPDAAGLEKAANSVAMVEGWLASIAVRAPIIRGLNGVETVEVPEPPKFEEPYRKLALLEGWATRAATLKVSLVGLNGVDGIPDLVAPFGSQTSALSFLDRMSIKVSKTQTDIDVLEAQVAAIELEEQEVQNAWDGLGVCPTCTQPMRVDTPAKAHAQEASLGTAHVHLQD